MEIGQLKHFNGNISKKNVLLNQNSECMTAPISELRLEIDKDIVSIRRLVNTIDENTSYCVDWHSTYHDSVNYINRSVATLYILAAGNPFIRFLNRFFHWFILIFESETNKDNTVTYSVVVRPCGIYYTKFLLGKYTAQSYRELRAACKKQYKSFDATYGDNIKCIKRAGYKLKDLTFKF